MEIRLERILLVDDEEENLKALERALRAQYEVVSVKSPDAAMQELQKKTFSVVISDQKMPGTSGTEFLAKVAQSYPLSAEIHRGKVPQIPAIPQNPAGGGIVKAWEQVDQAAFARAAGAGESKLVAPGDTQVDSLQDVFVAVIEKNLFENQFFLQRGQPSGGNGLTDGGLLGEELFQAFAADRGRDQVDVHLGETFDRVGGVS